MARPSVCIRVVLACLHVGGTKGNGKSNGALGAWRASPPTPGGFNIQCMTLYIIQPAHKVIQCMTLYIFPPAHKVIQCMALYTIQPTHGATPCVSKPLLTKGSANNQLGPF